MSNNNGTVSNVKAALSTKEGGKTKDVYTLSTGVRVRLLPVNSMLIQTAMAQIKDPPVPVVIDREQGKEWENPSDPAYINELTQRQFERGYARLNTVILWGVELADGLPEDDSWLHKLRLMEKQGIIDLSDFDFNNAIDKEFAYKKFIAVGNDVDEKDGTNKDISLILNRSVVSEEAVAEADEVFPGQAEQSADQVSAVKESEVVPE